MWIAAFLHRRDYAAMQSIILKEDIARDILLYIYFLPPFFRALWRYSELSAAP